MAYDGWDMAQAMVDMQREENAAAQAKLGLPKRRCVLHRNPLAKLLGKPARDQRLKRRKEQMLANGWCYHQVNHLSKVHDLDTSLYLTTLTRSPHRLVDHKRCVSHSACVAYNADIATYTTSHVIEDCNCLMVSTPYDSLIKIMRHGGIPLISIGEGTDVGATHTLCVHARSSDSKYIEISHVWQYATTTCSLLQIRC